MSNHDGQTRRLRALLESGGQVVGSATGVAVTVVAGPLLGASTGAAVGEALSRVAVEFHDRVLAPRQHARAGGALSVAVTRIGERLEAGDSLRRDGFFDADADQRADADEVLEGTLMTAANAWEERKVAPLGRFYANLAFDSSISPGWANYLLRVVEGLTYNQLVLMATIEEAERPTSPYERAFARLEAAPRVARVDLDESLYEQMDGLSAARLVGMRQNSGPPVLPSDAWGVSNWTPSGLARATLTAPGRSIYALMELHLLPRGDLDEILTRLVGHRDP